MNILARITRGSFIGLGATLDILVQPINSQIKLELDSRF
jgi:hypothetical protein